MEETDINFSILPSETKHDLISALGTLRLFIKEIERGYRFDDAMAEKIIERVKNDRQVIEDFFIRHGLRG